MTVINQFSGVGVVGVGWVAALSQPNEYRAMLGCQKDGNPTYAAINATLQPGQIIDRFGGSEVSRFFSPTGTPAAMRAFPPGTQSQPLRTFEVLKPIDVQSGRVAPAFNQIGLGTQFRSNQQLGELLEQGFLREVAK